MATTIGLGVTYPDTSLETSAKSPTRAIFGYGQTTTSTSSRVSTSNQVNNYGGVATDTTGVGTTRYALAAAGYGGDKAIFGYGTTTGSGVSMTNLVTNLGTIQADVTGVGTARYYLAAAGYGGDKAIFGYGNTGSLVNKTNLVSNIGGVVADQVTSTGTVRDEIGRAHV